MTLSFTKSDLAYWSVKQNGWVLENGIYDLCVAASAADIRLTAPMQINDGCDVSSPYSAAVAAAYDRPPHACPDCFPELIEVPISNAPKHKPITLESPLSDLKQTPSGWILYTAVMTMIKSDFHKAKRMPDSLERDTRLKNAYFLVRMMPSNSIRSMCMSSSGRFAYNTATGFVEIANGRLIRGLKAILKKQKVLPTPDKNQGGNL